MGVRAHLARVEREISRVRAHIRSGLGPHARAKAEKHLASLLRKREALLGKKPGEKPGGLFSIFRKRKNTPREGGVPLPKGVKDPYANVVPTPQNAAKLILFYKRKLVKLHLVPLPFRMPARAYFHARLKLAKSMVPRRHPTILRAEAARHRQLARQAVTRRDYAANARLTASADRLDQEATTAEMEPESRDGIDADDASATAPARYTAPKAGGGARRDDSSDSSEDDSTDTDVATGEDTPIWKRPITWIVAAAVVGAVALARRRPSGGGGRSAPSEARVVFSGTRKAHTSHKAAP